MTTLIIMAVGILVGVTIFPKKLLKYNHKIQPVITVALIFFMGVSLGARENFFETILTDGIVSLVLCVFPIIFSIILVNIVSKIFFVEKTKQGDIKK